MHPLTSIQHVRPPDVSSACTVKYDAILGLCPLLLCSFNYRDKTRGQWSFRPASKRAMKNKHMMLHDFNYFGANVDIAYNSTLNGILGHYSLQTASMVIEVADLT